MVSAFDLLYKEYDQSLALLNAKLRPADSRYKSEQILAQVLREAMSEASGRALTFHTQIALNQVASSSNPALTARERAFMANRASCDFVLYFKVGKMPLGVIEVDGASHDRPDQAERDALKNSILEKSHIPSPLAHRRESDQRKSRHVSGPVDKQRFKRMKISVGLIAQLRAVVAAFPLLGRIHRVQYEFVVDNIVG